MKKFIILMVAFFMSFGMATAQTVKNDGVFSHMYIGINGGAAYNSVGTISDFGFDAMNYNAGIELGKDVTPITGFSLQGIANPYFNDGFGIDRADVFGNVKFNLMNLFGGYKGYPRRVEIKTVTGIGMNHWFGEQVANPNDVSLQGGLEFDFNLGKNRNWYITFTPMLQSNGILRANEIQYAVKNADVKANVGIAYRFGNGNKSHNFTICPYKYTDEQYAELYNKYEECMNRPTVTDTVVIEKVVEKVVEVVVEKVCPVFVDFEIGSSELSNSAKNTILSFAKTVDTEAEVKVIGSADTKTGTKERNEVLASQRAQNVATMLSNLGMKNVSFETQLDIDEDAELSRCALIASE